MKKLNLVWIVLIGCVLTGCLVTSVYPFYHEKDLAYEPRFVGEWKNTEDEKERWKFEAGGTNAYRLTYTSGEKTYVMDAHLFKLGNQSFLDLFSSEEKDEVQPPPIPSHFLLRVFQVTPTLKMAALNYEWLKQSLAKEPKALRHHAIGAADDPDNQRIVLTADTAELQKFVTAHLKTEDAWKEAFELTQQAVPIKESKKSGE